MTIPSSSTHNDRATKRVLWTADKNNKPINQPRTPVGQKPPRKSRRSLRIAIFIGIILILVTIVFGFKILAASQKISVADRSLLGQVKDLLFSGGEHLKGEEEGRINILLIAIGGEGHSGNNLSDTIMVASIRPSDNKVALLSIPRDLYVQVPNEDYFTKINSIHALAESKEAGQGPVALQSKVEEITSLPMHYYARVDFTAFKNMIDAVGGVNVTIDNSFYDYWHKISFPAGTEKMNGERSLAYVRARYVEGPEGGDFSRAARQQQVLIALRDKVFSVQTALDFTALNGILNSVSDNIRTDMQLWEMKRFYELARMINTEEVNSVVLSTGPNGLLEGGTEILGGTPASVLYPRTGDFSEIHSVAQNMLNAEIGEHLTTSRQDTTTPPPTPVPTVAATPTPTNSAPTTKLTVDVRNSTNTAGLAKTTADKIEAAGHTVSNVANANTRNASQTTVYRVSETAGDTAQAVADLIDAQVSNNPPSNDQTTADVLVIIGQDL